MRLLTIILLFSNSFFARSCEEKQNNDDSKIGAKLFQKQHKDYSYFIEGVGKVIIDKVILVESELTTEYHYFAEGENRKGKSIHKLQSDGTYSGKWKTTADNGNHYEGTSWFKFNKDGSASGKWDWEGMPGNYEIRIDKNE